MDSSAIRTINAILERDAKNASYKFALLRGSIDVCQRYSHLREEVNGRVRYPLGLLVERWVLYYYPLIASPEFIPQKSGEQEDDIPGGQIAFRSICTKVTDYYQDKGGFSAFWNDYTRAELPEAISPEVLALFKQIRDTIVSRPMKHIGHSQSDDYYSIYGYNKQGISIRNDAYPDPEFILENFGSFDISKEMSLAFEYFGSFITGEDSILESWAEFSYQKSKKSVSKSQILSLLTTVPETERAVGMARKVYRDAFVTVPLNACGRGG